MSHTGMDIEIEGDIVLDVELRAPRQYKVLLHNDDYTSMDFVVHILTKVFRKNIEDAQQIMLAIHENGIGLCGVYTHEIAETKVFQVHSMAQGVGFPLRCSMEETE